MLQNVITCDVCEVYIKDLGVSAKEYFFGIIEQTDITQKLTQTILRGGIGNGIVGMINTDKEITFKVATVLHNDGVYELQSGSYGVSGDINVHKTESAICATNKLTITGTPVGTSVIVIDKFGTQTSGTYATGSVTITDGVEGDYYTVLYSSSETGEILTLDSKLFPSNYAVELHTIAYDRDTNEVKADVYWTFSKATPDGGISAQLSAGKNSGDTITFTAGLLAGATEYGKYVVVPRA